MVTPVVQALIIVLALVLAIVLVAHARRWR